MLFDLKNHLIFNKIIHVVIFERKELSNFVFVRTINLNGFKDFRYLLQKFTKFIELNFTKINNLMFYLKLNKGNFRLYRQQ
jgi:hypothetical protein